MRAEQGISSSAFLRQAQPGDGRAAIEGDGPVAVVADRPDAAARPADTRLRISAHALVLAAILLFLVYYCVWMPLFAEPAGYDAAYVTSVSPSVMEVRAPEASGVFHAQVALANGSHVKQGQILGRVDSPALSSRIEQQMMELKMLRSRQTQVEQRLADNPSDGQLDRESAELSMRIALLSASLEQLKTVESQLTIQAPADGFLQSALPANTAVGPNQTVIRMHPDGAPLLVEIAATMDVIEELQGRKQITVEFLVDGGKARATVRPISGTVRALDKADQAWGIIQCEPQTLPEAVHRPGVVGVLR